MVRTSEQAGRPEDRATDSPGDAREQDERGDEREHAAENPVGTEALPIEDG